MSADIAALAYLVSGALFILACGDSRRPRRPGGATSSA